MQDQTRSPDADGEQIDPSGVEDAAGVPDETPEATPPEMAPPEMTQLDVAPLDRGEVDALLLADGGLPDGGATWLTTPAPALTPADVLVTAEMPVPLEIPVPLEVPAPDEAPVTVPARNLDVPNEAIPAVPPEEGTDAVGTIPQVSLRKRWAKAQARNWRLYLVRFVIAGLAVVAAVAIVPGVWFTSWEWGLFTRIAVIFGLLNATVKPLLQFLALRFIFNTYGIVVIVINTLLLVLLSSIMDDVLQARSAIAALFAGAAVGAFGLLIETLLGANPPVLDRDYQERNGLR